ncbi:UNVERIFIED_CONTAM: heme peroxidase [Siphonaria sp. JEL0065]|nr:heme peroxidase [Siphonaria sp. JEL0065]
MAPNGASSVFRPGRADATVPLTAAATAAGKNDAKWDAAQIKLWLGDFGFSSAKDVVALMGSHNLGNCHLQVSGYAGPWTTTPLALSNEFFTLLSLAASDEYAYTNQTVTYNNITKWQWIDQRGRMMLPADMALIHDSEMLTYIQQYAADQNQFIRDYFDAYGRLLEVGVSSGLGAPVDTKVSAVTVTAPANTMCYPRNANPIVCVLSKPDNNDVRNTVFTVNSMKPGWVGFGIGSSMNNADVVIGWTNSTGGSVIQPFQTFPHGINVNDKSVWRQVPLAETAPSWARISFSVVHQNSVADDTGFVGNSIGNSFIFALSSYPPLNPDSSVTAFSFYQHEISGIFGDNGTVTPVSAAAGGLSRAMIAVVSILSVSLVAAAAVLGFVFRKKLLRCAKGKGSVPLPDSQNQLATSEQPWQSAIPAQTELNVASNEFLIASTNTQPRSPSTITSNIYHTSSSSSLQTPVYPVPSSLPPPPIGPPPEIQRPFQENLTQSESHSTQSHSPSVRTFQTESTTQAPEYSTVIRPTYRPATVELQQRPPVFPPIGDLFGVLNQNPTTSPAVARTYPNLKEINFQVVPGALATNPLDETMALQDFQDRVNGLLLKELQPPENPYVWSTADVAAWVLTNGGGSNGVSCCLTIREENITGKVLMITRIADLCQLLGVSRYGDKLLLDEGLKLLKRKGASFSSDEERVERPMPVSGDGASQEEPPLYLR